MERSEQARPRGAFPLKNPKAAATLVHFLYPRHGPEIMMAERHVNEAKRAEIERSTKSGKEAEVRFS
jgi:hypothetical protein